MSMSAESAFFGMAREYARAMFIADAPRPTPVRTEKVRNLPRIVHGKGAWLARMHFEDGSMLEYPSIAGR